MTSQSHRLTVLAIHGTFAPDAEWAQPRSTLHQLIQSEPGSVHINWVPFSWSGGNSHSARELASTELAKQVVDLSIQNPNADIHLIGHSHGGNVALMMLSAHLDVRPKVASVTCLSTPFLKFDVGGLEQHEEELKLISWRQIVFGFMMTLLFIHWGGLDDSTENLLLTCYILISACVYLFKFTLGQYLIDTDLRAIQRFYNYQRIKIPVLAVRVTRDEALLWIGAVHLIAEIPRRLRHVTLGLTFILLMNVVLWPFIIILSAFYPPARYFLLLGFLMLGWTPVLMVFFSNIRGFIRTGPWGLGEDSAFGYFSKFRTERWPSRIKTCKKVVLKVPILSRALRHSAAYNLSTCATEIAKFLSAVTR